MSLGLFGTLDHRKKRPFFDLPFSFGLSFAVTTQSANVLVVYE